MPHRHLPDRTKSRVSRKKENVRFDKVAVGSCFSHPLFPDSGPEVSNQDRFALGRPKKWFQKRLPLRAITDYRKSSAMLKDEAPQ
jgi:hypothetical protein